ncbi:MAG TPA: RNA-binding protein [Tissierellia bacterium]|nr:RNA-binding protein [Tissierellia bacterium]
MDNTQGLELGAVLISRSGRDKGRRFVLIEIVDHEYLLYADGDLRRMEKPKKKKVRHVAVTREILEDIREVLQRGELPKNEELRRALAQDHEED